MKNLEKRANFSDTHFDHPIERFISLISVSLFLVEIMKIQIQFWSMDIFSQKSYETFVNFFAEETHRFAQKSVGKNR